MLAIKKHPLSLKAATLGTIAFIIGLSGTALYIDRFRQHENLVFGREETVLGASDARTAEQKSPADEAQNAGSSQSTASPEVVSSNLEVVPMGGGGSASPAPFATAPTASAPTFTPGMGAGSTSQTAPSTSTPAPLSNTVETIQDSCLVNNCLQTTTQGVTNSLLGQ